MAKKQLSNAGLVLVAIVAIVAIFTIFYMSNTMTQPAQQSESQTNLAGQAMVDSCSIDTQAISNSCGQYNYLYGSDWDECFQKTVLSQYKEQGCIR